MLARILWWVSITPLGSPVLPLEKITVARSSVVERRAPRAFLRSLNGKVQASSSAISFSLSFGDSSTSSSKSLRAGTSIPGKRSRKALEVTTVCRLHWRAQKGRISLFAVDFFLTGNQSRRVGALLTNPPPPDGARTITTIFRSFHKERQPHS